MSDDFKIVQAVRAGDREAYAELVRTYQDRVLSVCFSLLYNRVEAEDAAQEAFLKAYTALDQYKKDVSFSAWVCRIATNTCLDLLRQRSRRRTDSLDALMDLEHAAGFEPVDPAGDGAARADRQERLALTQKILAQLSPDYRQILLLREVEDLSYEEIQIVLNCSLDAVKSRLKRARQDLQEKARHLLPDPTFINQERR